VKSKSDLKLRLRVITPTETKMDEEVDMVIMRCIDGAMGILPRHEAHICVLDVGALRILNRRRERRLAVFGGIAEVQDNVVTILTDEAHWPGDIDRKRAEEAREHLAHKIREKTDEMELLNDQALLRRALVQIEVGAFPLDSDGDEEE